MAAPSASATARSCILKPLNPRHKTLHVSLTTTSERFRFGRRAECEASFPNDHRISGVHASLLLDGNHHFAIEDTSVNGTFVMQERVPKHTRRALKSGDFFYLVIPDAELLQEGYTGSLTVNYVGYVFEETTPSPPPSTVSSTQQTTPAAIHDSSSSSRGGTAAAEPASFAAWWLTRMATDAQWARAAT